MVSQQGPFPWEERDEYVYVEGYGFAERPPLPARNLIRIYANAVGFTLLAFLLLQRFVPLLIVGILRLWNPVIRIYNNRFLAPPAAIETINILNALVCYLLPVLLLYAVLRIPAKVAFPLRRPRGAGVPAACVGVVLLSSTIGASISMLLSSLLSLVGLHPSGPRLTLPDTPLLFALGVVSTAVLPAIFEELLFRGVILQSLRRFGDLFALTATTLLFALLHRNLVQLPNAIITGMVLGFLALRTGSLAVPMLCHFFNNLLPLLLQPFYTSLGEVGGNLMYLGMNFVYILAGVLGLIYLLFSHPAFFTPLRGEGRRTERHKYASFFSSVPILALVLFLGVGILINMMA